MLPNILPRKDTKPKTNFTEVIISLASPESILERSYGEVTTPETINYRNHKPQVNGLLCERIFGPVKDWECHCGKYKSIKYKGIICDVCGVELTEKKVRRDRVGHIQLAVPVVHTWYFRSLPSKIGTLLGLPMKKLDQVVYYERYVIVQPGVKAEDGLSYLDFLTEEEYLSILDNLPRENQLLNDNDPNKFIAKTGAEALEMMLNRLDLETLSVELREQIKVATSQQRRSDALKRLKIVEIFRDAQTRIPNKPAWMIMRIIPVLPPDLRPLVPLDGGRFATSDLNDLYRRLIMRNTRLKNLIESKAPDLILRNEKRLLQEAVDSLFDNSRKVNTVLAEGSRVLKSLSDSLKGKQGRFRQNLLGKRVDYSGRSVIIVGPELKLHECGLPKDMAAELFKPFIIRRLMERGIAKTVKSAKKVVEKKTPVVWDILENVLKGHPVLLNRAPTLHRLSIQAFQPKLIEGKAIQLHPLVCTAFNADFDGDQMAVHVPLSHEAIAEAYLLMLASHNILNPANGTPLTVPTKDMILGLWYLTKAAKSTPENKIKGEGMIFYSPEEVIIAIDTNQLSIHALIKVRLPHKDDPSKYSLIETVAGRVIFNQYVPKELGFINELLNNKKLQNITIQVYRLTGTARTSKFLDDVKSLGFKYAYKSGISFSIDDIRVPAIKYELIEKANRDVLAVQENYLMGLITDNERYNQTIDIWTRVNTQVTVLLIHELESDKQGFNSIYAMMDSGARGSREQVRQLGGMRGLMGKQRKQLNDTQGDIIEHPIISNFKEGLNPLEYEVSTHGARKALADTALKTADSGYLTRRLVDVAKDVIIQQVDCKTLGGKEITLSINKESVRESIVDLILGRISLHDVDHPVTRQRLVNAGQEITEQIAAAIQLAGLERIEVRSVLACECSDGICVECYGTNLATGSLVHLGEAVGVIAAQSIGEPGTQLTLRTFHVGGAAASIAVESAIEATEKGIIHFEDFNSIPTTDSKKQTVQVVISRSCEVHLLDPDDKHVLMHKHIPYGAYLSVEQGQFVEKGQQICHWDPYNAVILTTIDGQVEFHAIEEGITYREEYDEQTRFKEKVIIESKDKTKNPSITVKGLAGESINYNIPIKARLVVENFAVVKAGCPLVKIPRVVTLSKDIVGGLPRVTELFEARETSNPSVLSEIDGYITYGPIKRGSREIIVESKDGIKCKYLVPLSKHILVQDNDYIKAGYPISDGNISLSSILNIKGLNVLQAYLIKELQDVYRLQGVRINDKHIEVIIRQMLRKLEIIYEGDTTFLPGQAVDKFLFRKENDRILNKKIIIDLGGSTNFKIDQMISLRTLYDENNNLKKKNLAPIKVRDAQPAVARLKLQGITQASLATESFISAASFQETTRVLSGAAIRGERDTLKGLKENVIVGHLIPIGTGFPSHQKLIVGLKEDYDTLMAPKDNVRK